MEVPLEVFFLIVVYSGLAITGFLGNTWVLITVSSQLIGCAANRTRSYKSVVQSSAYIYLLLLSVVDLVSLIPVPFLVTDIYENQFRFGEIVCKVIYICEGLNKTLSPMVLMALSVDRYIAVCHPTVHWMRQTRFALTVITVSFMLTLVFLFPITSNTGIQMMIDDNKKEIMKCAFNAEGMFLFELTHTIICYVIPLTIICGVYLAILRRLFIHTRFSTVGNKTSISLSRVVKCSVMVVAFYFFCWTPYWLIRVQFLIETAINIVSSTFKSFMNKLNMRSDSNTTLVDPPEPIVETVAPIINLEIIYMYLLHALPYAQSAFNWLFYAFLNRNLRNSTLRCLNGTRSGAPTSGVDNGLGNSNTMNTSLTPIWKNIQQMGTQIRTAGIDTGNAILKKSPFKTRSRIQSRSGVYLECSDNSPTNQLSASLLDIPRRTSLVPRQEPSLVGKALSYTNLPQSEYERIGQKEDSSHGIGSESSSVEWL